uniref:Nickel/cobalt efflux system n=1 Tax=Coccidioides posadasii RMSCC 3488 TaxID=454284 RepID=A0A0J6F8X4_COCPO|nr:high-affinity nickel transport protein nic1 [Coccidioides posadasii RMSCC 3488]
MADLSGPLNPHNEMHSPQAFSSFLKKMGKSHSRVPVLRRIPLPAIGIILLIAIANILVWIAAGVVLHFNPSLVSTAVLSYTLGLRHALDADHISAIDLMTRRLLATGQRAVTVGTFFSLGHSTIVIITSIVVAATAAAVSSKFDAYGKVGGIIGSSVSSAFLILLGIMNAYILYKLIQQIKKALKTKQGAEEIWKIEGGGVLFRVLKAMFKLINRPWKMYPLGVLFGLGFDTSSEIALLGISSVQAAKGTSIWVILIFPILFTVIGVLQLLTLILNAAEPEGRFWDGVETAGEYYDVIGGAICGCFIIIGGISVLVYPNWRQWAARKYATHDGPDEIIDDVERGGGSTPPSQTRSDITKDGTVINTKSREPNTK